jgi:N6-adenosine-specific RNA methylase IME4
MLISGASAPTATIPHAASDHCLLGIIGNVGGKDWVTSADVTITTRRINARPPCLFQWAYQLLHARMKKLLFLCKNRSVHEIYKNTCLTSNLLALREKQSIVGTGR